MIKQHQVCAPLVAFQGVHLPAWRWLLVIVIGAAVIVGAVILSPWQRGGGSGNEIGSAHSASAWPRLAVPPGDGGIRVQLLVNPVGILMPTSEAVSERPVPIRDTQTVLLRLATGKVWHFRTDHLGRFQVALPPGRYVLGLASQYPRGPTWPLRIRANMVTSRRLHESVI